MAKLDAVLIATDLYREVPGAGFRDEIRLTLGGHAATMEFLLEYFRAGKDACKAAQQLQKNRRQRVTLPLNGPYLHQYLARRGLRTEIVPFFSLQKDRLLDLLGERPRTVVISTTFLPFAPQIESVAAFVREHAPETVIIAGGIQIWKSYRTRELLEGGVISEDIRDAVVRDHYLMDLLRPSQIDLLVVSDQGEYTLSRLLRRMRQGDDCRGMDNTAHFSEGRWHLNPVGAEPDGFLVEPVDWSQMPSALTSEEIPVHAGTGCPFRCAFCDFCSLRPLRSRPVASVIEEIRSIPPVNGVRQVFFTDDNLFFTLKQVKDFCNALIEAELSLRWRAFTRVDTITDETADLLRRSGCWECLLGVESGDAELLRNMNKKTTPDAILRAVTSLNKVGINTQSTFLVGFPGETDRSVRNTIDLLNAYPTKGPGIHTYFPFLFLVAPLAPVASPESRAKYQLKGYLDEWSHYTMNSKEAERHVLGICNQVKMEISPVYHGERVVSWLPPEDQKRVISLRNRINRLQRGILFPEPQEPLWTELEGILTSAIEEWDGTSG